MTNILLNRTVQFALTNESGGDLAQGDVVIVDDANFLSVTTTTTSGYKDGEVGVVIDPGGIADGESGMIAFAGYVPKLNLSSAADFADLVKTDEVAGQGVPHAAPLVAGDFAQVLDEGTSPPAILFGHVEQGGGGGGDVATDTIWDAKGDLAVGTDSDTAARLPVGSNGQYPIAESSETTGLLWVTGGMRLISESSPSGTGTVTFSSIPGGYRMLRLYIFGRSTKSDNIEDMNLEFNADTTAANYRYAYNQVYSTSSSSLVEGDDRIMARITANNSPSNAPGSYVIDIPYYSNTSFNKVAIGQGAARYDSSGTQLLALSHWMEWENTAAITRIDLKLPSGNWASGTKISLYGIY